MSATGPAQALSLAPLVFALLLCLLSAAVVSEAEATTYHIRSQTAARATQHLRSDTTLAAPRVFSQALTLSAFDMRANNRGDVNARLSLRYHTDFALTQRLRQDPLFDARFNDISLDLAYVQWRPFEALELTGGRQWHFSSLGVTDFDGLAIRYGAVNGEWRPFVSLALGRDVQRGLTPFDPGAFDIQGLPPNESLITDDPWHFLGALRVGAAYGNRHRLELAATEHRRPASFAPDHEWGGGDQRTRRVGTAATLSPRDDLTLTTTAAYHSLIAGIDRATLDAAFRRGTATLSAGLDQRHPVFDSSSIFNLFGARPHRGAYASWAQRIEPLSSTLEVRGWTRGYFEERAHFFEPADAYAFGGALAAHHRFDLFVPLDLSWQLSAQTFTDQSGGDQYLGDLRLRAPGPVDGLYLTGRLLGLYARPSHHRRPAGYATSTVLGGELDVGDVGRLTLAVEGRGGSFTPQNAALFALFELEAWR